jgi:hypothetical protein
MSCRQLSFLESNRFVNLAGRASRIPTGTVPNSDSGLRENNLESEVMDMADIPPSYRIIATFYLGALALGAPLSIRMLALTDPRPPLLALSTGGVNDQPFHCQSLAYRESASLSLPEGINLSEKIRRYVRQNSWTRSKRVWPSSRRFGLAPSS